MKKILFALLFVLALSMNVYAATNSNLKVTLVNQNPDPVEPGKYVDLRFQIVNEGTDTVNNAIFEVTSGYPFIFDQSDTPRKIISISSSSKTKEQTILFYRVKLDDKATQENFDFNMRYSVDGGATWTQPESFVIRVKLADVSMGVDQVVLQPAKISPGKSSQLQLRLVNYAPKYIKNVRVNLDLTGLPIAAIGSSNEKVIERIDAGEKSVVAFSLASDFSAESKLYKLPVSIRYMTDLGEEKTKSVTVGVPVYDEPSIFVNLEETGIYKADQEGRVVISISNTGTSNINFAHIRLLEDENYAILSASSSYLGNLESDDYQTAEFKIRSKPSVSGAITIKSEISYKDGYNEQFTNKYEMPIKIYTSEEAIKYGLEQKQSNQSLFFVVTFGVLSFVFWISMIVNLWKNKMDAFDKTLWFIVVILTFVIGALVYYIFGRKKA